MNVSVLIEENSDAGPVQGSASGRVSRALQDVLAEGIDIHRCLAARALGKIGHPSAVPALVKALLDEDEDVRTDAAVSLQLLVDPASATQLFENLLGDPCTEVKLAAIDTLAKLKDPKIIPWLRRLVKGRDEEIVWDEQEFFASGWDDWVEVQNRAVAALAELNVIEAVPDIVNALDGDDAQDLIETAFHALSRLDNPGIDALAIFLTDNQTRVRRRAAAAIASIVSDGVADALTVALTDPSAEVRLAALRGRADLLPEDPQLAWMLEDADATVRAAAVSLIGQHHIEKVLDLIDDPSEAVQAASFNLLADADGLVTDKGTLRILDDKATSGGDAVAGAAAAMLAAHAEETALPLLLDILGGQQHPVSRRLGAMRALVGISGNKVTEALVGQIDDENRQIRLETMTALARIAKDADVWPNMAGEALLTALNGAYQPEEDEEETEPEVAEEPEADEPAEEPELAAETEDPDSSFPASTLESMLQDAPQIAPAVGLPEAGIALSETDMERLAIAKNVLSKKKVNLFPELILHEDIRRFAARVLGDIARQDVASGLIAVLDSEDNELAEAAADSLARIMPECGGISEESATKIKARMETAERTLKLALIRVLAGCDVEVATTTLAACLDDGDSFIRAEAINALSDQNQVGSRVHDLLKDTDPSVRMNAAKAIGKAAEPEAIDQLVAFAFSFEGYHCRQTARLLRELDPNTANTAILTTLNDLDQIRLRSVAIECLEELNQPRPV